MTKTQPLTYKSLKDIASELKNLKEKIIVLYAFNGTGKTRLSMEFKELVNEKENENEVVKQVIYYNAYTEDLFYWDNDLENNNERKLKINVKSNFISLIKEYGKENVIAEKFKELTLSKIEPSINVQNGEVTFSLSTGDGKAINNIKISRGEENVFIWTMFYALLETVIDDLNIDEVSDRTGKFNEIKYIYIDDPVSSLDDNHIIELAIDLKKILSKSKNENLKFIISTHHTLFYSVLYNEITREKELKHIKKIFCSLIRNEYENNYYLKREKDGIFAYHLLLKKEIQQAIDENRIEKYHFTLFRNLLEKTANYLGYNDWGKLITGEQVTDENRAGYIRRINLFSHNNYPELEYRELIPAEKEMLKLLFNNFKKEFKWEE